MKTFLNKVMKKILILIALCFLLSSCKHVFVRQFGANETINLPTGMKLVEATWKESNLWYLVEPMEEDYVPKTKVFIENSNAGMMEGKVTFVETR